MKRVVKRSEKKTRYSQLIPYLMRQRGKLCLILGLIAVTSAITAIQPLPLKLLVDHALGHSEAPGFVTSILQAVALHPSPAVLILVAALASLGLFAISSAVSAGLLWAQTSAGQSMVCDLNTDVFHRLQRLSLAFHVRRPVGDSLSRLSEDSWSVNTLASVLMSPAQNVLTLLTVGAVAWQLDAKLAALSLAVAPMLAAISVIFGQPLKRRAKSQREVQTRLLTFVHQTLQAVPVVQAFASERRNRLRFRSLADDAVTLSQQGALLTGAYGLLIGFVTTAGAATVLYVGGGSVLSGSLSLGTLLVFLAYMRTM